MIIGNKEIKEYAEKYDNSGLDWKSYSSLPENKRIAIFINGKRGYYIFTFFEGRIIDEYQDYGYNSREDALHSLWITYGHKGYTHFLHSLGEERKI